MNIQTETEFNQALDGLKARDARTASDFFWNIGDTQPPAKAALTPAVLCRIVDEFAQPSGYPDGGVNSRSMSALRKLVRRADQSTVMPVLEKLEGVVTNPGSSDASRSDAALILRDSKVYKTQLTPDRVNRLLDVVEDYGKSAGSEIIFMLSESRPGPYRALGANLNLDPFADRLARIADNPRNDGWEIGNTVKNYFGDVLDRRNPPLIPASAQDPAQVIRHGSLVESETGRPWMMPEEFNRLRVGPGEALVTVVSGLDQEAFVTSGNPGVYEKVFQAYAKGGYTDITTYRVPHSKLAMRGMKIDTENGPTQETTQAMQAFFDNRLALESASTIFGDAQKARDTVRDLVGRVDAADAFDAVLKRKLDDGQPRGSLLLVSAEIAELTSPTHPDNRKNDPFRLGLYAAAVNASAKLMREADPKEMFGVLTENPDRFSRSPQLATLALQALSRFDQGPRTSNERLAINQATAYLQRSVNPS